MWFSADLYGGFCETFYWGWRGEPLNTASSLVALLWVVYIFYTAADVPRVQVLPGMPTMMTRRPFPAGVALGCGLLATSGLCSALYHAFLFETFGRMDTGAMAVGGWVAAGIVAHLLVCDGRELTVARARLLALLGLLGGWLLFYTLALGDQDTDTFMWLLLVPNGLWLLGLLVGVLRSDKDAGDTNRDVCRWGGALFCAILAIVSWTQTERSCQRRPELAGRYFWGHSLFHVLAYSAYGLGLLIVRDL